MGGTDETELRLQASTGIVSGKTLQDAFDRYLREVSPHKRTNDWEATRLRYLARYEVEGQALGKYALTSITPALLGAWRDARLQEVAGSTINRDLNLLSHVLTTAAKEWRWIDKPATSGLRRPKNPAPRDRRITDAEIERICFALGFDEDTPTTTRQQAVAVAFLFALETAMRAGEICRLTPADIIGRTARLEITKNGSARTVPLSKRARQLLDLLPPPEPGQPLFGLTAGSLDTLFRRAVARCQIDGLTFHDSRHEAITRLATKLNVLELARMVGHRDLRMLQIYYNETAEKLAKKLD